MATPNQPATSPAGAPQDSSQQNNQAQNTGVPVGTGGEKKLIAGKFATVEEAVEKGYMGMEQGYQRLSEEVSGLRQALEALVQTPTIPVGAPPRGNYGGGYQHDPYGRGAQPNDDYIDPAQFITNPGEHLRAREERLRQQITNDVTQVVLNAAAVNDFKAHNPDLLKHEKIVQAFMRDQDARLPVGQRLENAGKAARDYLATLRSDQNQQNQRPPANAPTGSNYIEGPSGGAPNQQGNQGEVVDEGEQSLVEYINERNSLQAQHFGFGLPNNSK